MNSYVPVAGVGIDRERAIFPETAVAFLRETQPREWTKLEVLPCEKNLKSWTRSGFHRYSMDFRPCRPRLSPAPRQLPPRAAGVAPRPSGRHKPIL